MRLKTFLLAAIAICSFHVIPAVSVHDNCNDRIKAPNVIVTAGEVFSLPMTLHRELSENFTNLQFDIVFPVGIYPEQFEGEEIYDWAGDDIPLTGRYQIPCITFRNNYDVSNYYPYHRVVGTNMTKFPVTANPCDFYTLNLRVDDEMPSGVYELIQVSQVH